MVKDTLDPVTHCRLRGTEALFILSVKRGEPPGLTWPLRNAGDSCPLGGGQRLPERSSGRGHRPRRRKSGRTPSEGGRAPGQGGEDGRQAIAGPRRRLHTEPCDPARERPAPGPACPPAAPGAASGQGDPAPPPRALSCAVWRNRASGVRFTLAVPGVPRGVFVAWPWPELRGESWPADRRVAVLIPNPGHTPWLQVPSLTPVGVGGNQLMCFSSMSLSLPPPSLPLSLSLFGEGFERQCFSPHTPSPSTWGQGAAPRGPQPGTALHLSEGQCHQAV